MTQQPAEIASDALSDVLGGGATRYGTPIFGRIGRYEQLKNIDGSLHRRELNMFTGKTTNWRPYHPTWPNYEGQ